MARYIALGVWFITGIAVFLFLFASAQELDSSAQDQLDSAEENRQSGPGLQQSANNNRRRAGGTIKYKKISVMKSGSAFEKPGFFEVPDLGQNKTRRLKPKTSNRHTMIYRPTKKSFPSSKKEISLGLSTATTPSPEVKVQRLPDSGRNYGTKSWQQVQPVTEVINSFIRPTKRNRVRVNNRPSNDITASITTPVPKVTLDPLRPISRVRSGSITTTTTPAPTTTKFLRLSRKPNRWPQSNVSNNKKHQHQPAKEHGTDNSELPVIPTTTESTTVAGISSSPKTNVIHLTEATVISDASNKDEAPESSAEIEHVKEESAIRKIAAKPDKIAYFDMSESLSRPTSGHKDSSQEQQQRTSRPRLHVPKKDSAHYESQRETNKEPILLQTKEQREQQQQQQQQQLEKNEDALHRPEVSVQFPRVRQRLPQPESNSPQPFATVEETEKRLEKYEAEKNKQLDRLRQSKIPDAVIQLAAAAAEESPRARIVPSRAEYQNGPVRIKSAPLNEKEESAQDFTRVPPSLFGQRLPQSDSRPAYYEFEASYPAPGKVEQQRYVYNPSAGTKSNSNQERYRPETEYNTTPRPNHDSNPRPEVIYIHTTPRPDEEKYLRPEVIYTSRPNANEDRRPEIIYTTVRPIIANEDRRPDVIYQTTTRPIVSDEQKHRRPEIIYTPPEHEYQPPSAYLSNQGTYPRVRIAYQPAPSTIPPPPVTYEPPHLEFMPPSASPPPRIYVPPVEEYKPPATTAAVVFQGLRPEEKTPSVVHSQRFEDARVSEGLRKLEAINSYTRLVSVGHPSVKQLPYPPERDGPTSGSSRPVQQPEPIVITVTENPYRSYERAQSGNEKGERFQEKPYVLHGNYQRDPAAGKSHLVESAYIVGSATPVVHKERPRPTFEGSSFIVGKPYPTKDEGPVQIHVASYASYERPKSESLILERPVYSSPSGEINTGRRFPDPPPTSERPSYQQPHQLNQPNNQPYQSYQSDQPYQSYQPNPSQQSYRTDPSHQSYQVIDQSYPTNRPDQSHPSYRPDQSHQTYQSNQPSQAYHSQQLSNQYNPQLLQSKEPRKLNFPPSASERPYVIHLPAGRDVIEVTDNRYENVIPVSEQPQQHKHYGPPAVADAEIVVQTERPPQEIRYVATEKPITVTVRPHGVPSPESERSEIAYQSQVTSDQSSLLKSISDTKTNMAKNQNQQLTIQDQQTRPAAADVIQSAEQKPQHHQQSESHQSSIPASFYPIGPVRAYQVTHAVYPSPPPRFFQLPGLPPNPFEDQFPASTPSSTPPPPTPPPTTPPTRQQYHPSTFENHLPKGDTWAVNPLFQNQDQFPSSRPFTSSIQPLITEETPHSSEKVVRYRPASFYHDNERLNRSLAHHTVPSQQPQLLYDSPIVIHETYRVIAEDLTYHPPPGNNNEPTEIGKQIFNRPQENPSHLQPTQVYYNNQPQDSYNHQQQSEQDFSGVEGTPGVDYPILHSVPHDLKFKCELVDSPGTRHPAYYADPYTRCQVFHVCQSNRAKNSFLCPNGTIFNQKVRVCDWWHNVQCEESSAYYNVNTDDENNYQFKLSSN